MVGRSPKDLFRLPRVLCMCQDPRSILLVVIGFRTNDLCAIEVTIVVSSFTVFGQCISMNVRLAGVLLVLSEAF